MNLTFRDLYDAMRNTEIAFTRMDMDIDNALCGNPKCVLNKAQEKLLDTYMDLANVDMDFCTLNFDIALQKMKRCFDCIDEEIEQLLPVPEPPPVATVENCRGDIPLTLDDITKFVIYERTYTSTSISSPVQAYVVPKKELPMSFIPSVPSNVSSHEKYWISWNKSTGRLKVKLDHDQFPDSMGAPKGSYNVTMIMAELTQAAQDAYGIVQIAACRAFLLTDGVEWASGHGLENTVDGDWNTYPSCSNTPNEIVVEYEFFV